MVTAQILPPEIQWQRSFGGSGLDFTYPSKPLALPDGGFLLPGTSSSYPWYTKTSPWYGSDDFWLIRTDAQGNELWQRSYGGSLWDTFPLVALMKDGSVLLAGVSGSTNDGNKTVTNNGFADTWLLKLNENGEPLWQRSLGTTNSHWVMAMHGTIDGGFILGGEARSCCSGELPGGFGGSDAWVARLDSEANLVWLRYFGGTGNESLRDIRETSDGGFVFVADSDSPPSGNKTTPNFGLVDGWVVRLDRDGNKSWEQTFGGDNFDYPMTLATRPDGGIFVGINTVSEISGNKTVPERGLHGFFDIWLISLDSSGQKLWEQSYGGLFSDMAMDFLLMPDGGLMIVARSDSDDGDRSSPAFGFDDWWLLRLDQYGKKLYDMSFGGSGFDDGIAIIRTFDGGFLCFGDSASPADGNKTTPNYGSSDYWVVKLGPERIADADNDGVPDLQDVCPQSPAGSVVDASGCSLEQLVPCDANWRNHGEYMSALSRAVHEFVNAGLVSQKERGLLMQQAAQSDCGERRKHRNAQSGREERRNHRK